MPELEADAIRRSTELGVARTLREELQHALFVVAQVLTRAAGELGQNGFGGFCGALDAPAPLATALIIREAHRLIDDVEPQIVMDEAGLRVDLGINARPELNGRFEPRGARKQLALSIGMKGEEDEAVGYRERAICDSHVMVRFLRALIVWIMSIEPAAVRT